MRRSFVYKLDPNCTQRAALERTLEICRTLYNLAIEQRRFVLSQRPRDASLSWYDQKREIKELRPYGKDLGFLDVPSTVVQDLLLRVHRAFDRHQRRDRAGHRTGLPHFRRRDDYRSWTYASLGDGVSLRPDGRLRLFAIGAVRVHWHRALAGRIKTVTIIREADGWYVSFGLDEVQPQILPPTGRIAALDVRIAPFAAVVAANATSAAGGAFVAEAADDVTNPRFFEQARRHLRRAQRRLARRKPKPGEPPSKGYLEAKELVAKAHLQVRRQRADFHHVTARSLVRAFDTIYHEDLAIVDLLVARAEEKDMASGDHAKTPPKAVVNTPHPRRARTAHNRGISDSGWGQFFGILAATGEETGRRVQKVPPQNTTRMCSQCGYLLTEPVRSVFLCPACGYRAPRAENAARNVLRVGTEAAISERHALDSDAEPA